ncbi:unnamed protein product [Mytilus coruscus]|uniref:Reverse transcriptase RNase H-like domain-containing protein n=1 Tax=Mytilus coruscus TaxID=42192 RepID=A0A6J8DTT0_MYTCO|nr:unnamed protein product [Mytilus coruscus]
MPDGIYVKGFIEVVDVIFTADTGACKTVLSEKIFNKIPLLQRPKLRKTSPLTGASGESVKLLGKANFNIILGSLEIVAEIVVANIEDQCLLGIDILQGQQGGPANILLSKGVINLKGVSIPCIQIKKSEISRKVSAADHFIIPGYCEAVIDVYIERNENDELIASKEFMNEPSEEFIANNKIAMAACVVDIKDNVTVKARVLNPSSEEVSIKQDTIIGKASSFLKILSSLKDMENADKTENFSAIRRPWDGAVLSQIQNQQEKVIAYGSRILNKAERNYCVTDKELLALRYFVEYYRQYLLGHLGQKKSRGKALQKFFWYLMKEDINNYVNACDICAQNKPPHKAPKAPLGKMGVGAPMDRLATDIIGPCRSEYDLNSHTRGYTKHVREVQTLQKNGQTYNERNYLKKASVPYIFEDGRDIVKQSYAESQKHWASRAGIRIKSFPKPIKPTLPKYTATPIPIAPKPLAPLETSTATYTAASIDSYTRLLQSNMPCLSMPAFSTYSVAQTAPSPYLSACYTCRFNKGANYCY